MSTEDTTPEERRRGHSPWLVASVAAAVLLAGGGGAYWAATAGGGGGDGGRATGGEAAAPPPLALDGYRPGGGPPQGIAVGEPDPNGVRYRAEGRLPDGPRSAPVYRSAEVSREAVAALARALGVDGTPRQAAGVWTVDGASGPVLRVDGRGHWSYARQGLPGGKPCERPPGAGPERRAGDACPVPHDPPGGPGEPAAAHPVPEEKARSAALPVLRALGQEGAALDAHRTFGTVRLADADPVLDSVPTHGWRTTLEIGPDGRPSGGSGQLVMPRKDAVYPLVPADRALAELNRGAGTGQGGIGGCATPVPLGQDPGDGRPTCGAPRDPVPVTGARYALAALDVAGRPALVPSWLFEVRVPGAADSQGTVTVVQPAVDPRSIRVPSAPASGGPSSSPPKVTPMRVESYGVDGRRLTLRFWGGVCADYSASAQESSAAALVRVTGVRQRPERPCIMIAKRFEQVVKLDRPLDGRRVVDAVTGEPVPQRA
ncbi:hypothetical protein [Streptomyces orinoci]|uniref:Large membrane protein n=1 Tax=Streptomyces orinoci TaxID=67339 RepID=A0ABV3JVU7_STRON|nr:hypothetical protein [Streptomyces orinoci]